MTKPTRQMDMQPDDRKTPSGRPRPVSYLEKSVVAASRGEARVVVTTDSTPTFALVALDDLNILESGTRQPASRPTTFAERLSLNKADASDLTPLWETLERAQATAADEDVRIVLVQGGTPLLALVSLADLRFLELLALETSSGKWKMPAQ